MILETHWLDSSEYVELMESKLKDVLSELSEENKKNLEDLLDHYYEVGAMREFDSNNPDL